MEDKIKNLIKKCLEKLDLSDVQFDITHPKHISFGDYSTNLIIKMGPAGRTKEKDILDFLIKNVPEEIDKVDSKGGFINFYLSKKFFTDSIKEILKQRENWGKNNLLEGKKIMVEYTDPNPFKPFHIGHLMSNAIGESISRIFKFSGAKIINVNYQGDVGLHVAKAIYGMYKAGPPKDESAPVSVLAKYIGECYAHGSEAYESDEKAKKEIDEINKKVYDKSDQGINKVYDWGRKVTLEAFEEIYKILDTEFKHLFFESEMAPIGQKIVQENTGKVFEKSDGAVVFKGEEHDPKLHTRVFITSAGLPTYETKELGLTKTKFEKENPDMSVVITAHEQAEFMKVVQKALSLIYPDYEKKMKHITHGMMRLESGKMSSRKGNVVTGESLITDTLSLIFEKLKEREWSDEEKNKIAEIVGVAAIKYSILRSQAGSDIVYDVEKSISVEGDSGPYLQYALVRANSVLEKSDKKINPSEIPEEIFDIEKILYRFPEIVIYSYQKMEPHHIATYLTELASNFNSFYSKIQIINKEDKYSPYYLALTKAFLTTMQNGLYLLGIKVPERM